MDDARRVAVASGFAVLQRLLVRSIGIVSTLVLVRLLAPDDFGVVALAAAVHGTLESLTNLSFGLALIRMREPEREHYDTAFTLGLMRAAVIAVGLVATAGLQADFMGDARIGPVIHLLAISVVLQAFESIRMIDLQRALRFDLLMRYVLLHKLVGFAIALPVAFWLRNYWALVVAMPLGWLVMIPVSYRLAPYRPRLGLKAWRALFGFSKWLVVGNVFHVVESQLMTVALGRLSGIGAAGLFQVAHQIAALPVTELAAPLRGPAYVGFARARENIPELRHHVIASLALQATLIAPLSIGIALAAHEITLLFLGPRWIDLVTLMQITALYSLLDAPAAYMHHVLIALGRQGLHLAIYASIVAVRVAAVVAGALHGGMIGAAGGMLLVSGINMVSSVGITAALIDLGPTGLAKAFGRPTLSCFVMTAAVYSVAGTIVVAPDGLAQASLALVMKATCGAAVYCVAILAMWLAVGAPGESAEANILKTLRHGLRVLRRGRG